MLRKVRVYNICKGKIVNPKYIKDNLHLFNNQPPYIEVIIRLEELEIKTDIDKTSFLFIDENGNIVENLNKPFPAG